MHKQAGRQTQNRQVDKYQSTHPSIRPGLLFDFSIGSVHLFTFIALIFFLICLFILFVCQFFPFVHLSIYRFIYRCISLRVCFSMSASLYFSHYLSVCLSVCLFDLTLSVLMQVSDGSHHNWGHYPKLDQRYGASFPPTWWTMKFIFFPFVSLGAPLSPATDRWICHLVLCQSSADFWEIHARWNARTLAKPCQKQREISLSNMLICSSKMWKRQSCDDSLCSRMRSEGSRFMLGVQSGGKAVFTNSCISVRNWKRLCEWPVALRSGVCRATVLMALAEEVSVWVTLGVEVLMTSAETVSVSSESVVAECQVRSPTRVPSKCPHESVKKTCQGRTPPRMSWKRVA